MTESEVFWQAKIASLNPIANPLTIEAQVFAVKEIVSLRQRNWALEQALTESKRHFSSVAMKLYDAEKKLKAHGIELSAPAPVEEPTKKLTLTEQCAAARAIRV